MPFSFDRVPRLRREPIDQPAVPLAVLVHRTRQGDPETWNQLCLRSLVPLKRMAIRLLGNEMDAEDVVQDVLLKLPVSLRRYQEIGAFDAWLKGVLFNAVRQRWRTQRLHPETDMADDLESGGSESGEWIEDQLAWRDGILALPGRLRIVWTLNAEGFSHDDIAAQLGITAANSAVILNRARRQLMHRLAREQVTHGPRLDRLS